MVKIVIRNRAYDDKDDTGDWGNCQTSLCDNKEDSSGNSRSMSANGIGEDVSAR